MTNHIELEEYHLPQAVREGRNAMLAGKVGQPLDGTVIHALNMARVDLQSVKAALAATGFADIQLQEDFDAHALRSLGLAMGELIPEMDIEALKNSDLPEVLQLAVRYGDDADFKQQPFSTQALSLHTEMSQSPAERHPRYLVLACLNESERENSGLTILVSQRDVLENLQPGTAQVLEAVRLRPELDATPILLRLDEGDCRFAFRDPLPSTIEAYSLEYPAEVIQQSIVDLYTSINVRAPIYFVHWRRGRVVVFDNHKFIHGRSCLLDNKRVLARLRIK